MCVITLLILILIVSAPCLWCSCVTIVKNREKLRVFMKRMRDWGTSKQYWRPNWWRSLNTDKSIHAHYRSVFPKLIPNTGTHTCLLSFSVGTAYSHVATITTAIISGAKRTAPWRWDEPRHQCKKVCVCVLWTCTHTPPCTFQHWATVVWAAVLILMMWTTPGLLSCTLNVVCSHQRACIFLFGTSECLQRTLWAWWWWFLLGSYCKSV